ncbi:MAG: tetratricopeptide repeat-containing glycosyltransferase family protein [Verrucomicrobiota bacterium]|jgi:Tfp pilus assembly protein PilF
MTEKPNSSADPVEELLRRGGACAQQGQALAAAKLFVAVLEQQPDCFEAHCRLGQALRQLNQLDEAAHCLETAIRLRPAHPQLHLLLGAIHKQRGALEIAADCCRREIALDPRNPDAHYNLGLVLQNLQRPLEAMAAYRQALALRPDYVGALVNQSALYQEQPDLDAAIACCEQALRLEPAHAEAHWQLGTALLAKGQWERGWQEYEWRWKLKDFTTPDAAFPQSLWDGGDLGGRRILLHAEQGYGDMIQFIRYAPLVAQRGGEVLLGCPPALAPLLARAPGVSQVATARAKLPAFQVHAPLLSLPAIFRTTPATLPAKVPYLTPPEQPFPIGQQEAGCLKVGLAWAGDAKHKNDRNRSMPLDHFRRLMGLPKFQWFSLQADARASDLAQAPWTSQLTDLGSSFGSFDDAASAIVQLDLVISVDTAVAHLAGALGKPTWTLLPFAGEWRWMVHRPDSPWYPTMRLFRQSQPGDWPGLMDSVRHELLKMRQG